MKKMIIRDNSHKWRVPPQKNAALQQCAQTEISQARMGKMMVQIRDFISQMKNGLTKQKKRFTVSSKHADSTGKNM